MLLEWWSCTECTLFTDEATVGRFGREHVVIILNHNFEIDFLCGWTMCERFGVLGVSQSAREGAGGARGGAGGRGRGRGGSWELQCGSPGSGLSRLWFSLPRGLAPVPPSWESVVADRRGPGTAGCPQPPQGLLLRSGVMHFLS